MARDGDTSTTSAYPEDARGLMVRLTPAGKRAVEDAAPEHSDTVRQLFFDQLSEEELAMLGPMLDRVLDNLRRDREDQS